MSEKKDTPFGNVPPDVHKLLSGLLIEGLKSKLGLSEASEAEEGGTNAVRQNRLLSKTLTVILRHYLGSDKIVIDKAMIDTMPGTAALMIRKEKGKVTMRVVTEEEYAALSQEERDEFDIEGNPFAGEARQ